MTHTKYDMFLSLVIATSHALALGPMSRTPGVTSTMHPGENSPSLESALASLSFFVSVGAPLTQVNSDRLIPGEHMVVAAGEHD